MLEETWWFELYYGSLVFDKPKINIWTSNPDIYEGMDAMDEIIEMDCLLEIAGCLDSPAEHQWHLSDQVPSSGRM